MPNLFFQIYLKFQIYLFVIYFWLHWVFVAMGGLLTAMASLVAEHGLQACGLQ